MHFKSSIHGCASEHFMCHAWLATGRKGDTACVKLSTFAKVYEFPILHCLSF